MGEAACKLKIILNGGSVSAEVDQLCYQVEELAAERFAYSEGQVMVRLLNIAENAVFAAKRVFLELNGFTGPWPASLDNLEVQRLIAISTKGVDKAPAVS